MLTSTSILRSLSSPLKRPLVHSKPGQSFGGSICINLFQTPKIIAQDRTVDATAMSTPYLAGFSPQQLRSIPVCTTIASFDRLSWTVEARNFALDTHVSSQKRLCNPQCRTHIQQRGELESQMSWQRLVSISMQHSAKLKSKTLTKSPCQQ